MQALLEGCLLPEGQDSEALGLRLELHWQAMPLAASAAASTNVPWTAADLKQLIFAVPYFVHGSYKNLLLALPSHAPFS